MLREGEQERARRDRAAGWGWGVTTLVGAPSRGRVGATVSSSYCSLPRTRAHEGDRKAGETRGSALSLSLSTTDYTAQRTRSSS